MPGGLLGCVIVFLYSERIQTQSGDTKPEISTYHRPGICGECVDQPFL